MILNQEKKIFFNSSAHMFKKTKIFIEKRKRYQTYIALDYILSAVTYFDFFSLDTFKIIKKAKYLAQICNKNVTNEFLLLPFFYHSLEISMILNEFNITQILVENSLADAQEKKPLFYENYIEKILHFFNIFENVTLNKEITYSYKINQLFNLATENALLRFKTPVISPEIFLITIMEEKNTNVAKTICNYIKDKTEWYLLRYKLVKRLYYQESNIREEIIKNQRYFAYLLKTQLSEYEFNKLIKTKKLAKGISFFRNILIFKILKKNIFLKLSKEIQTSIKTIKKRNYSTY